MKDRHHRAFVFWFFQVFLVAPADHAAIDRRVGHGWCHRQTA